MCIKRFQTPSSLSRNDFRTSPPRRPSLKRTRDTATLASLPYTCLPSMARVRSTRPCDSGEIKASAELYAARMPLTLLQAVKPQEQTCELFSTVPFSIDPAFIDRPRTLAWLHEKSAGLADCVALVRRRWRWVSTSLL